MQAAAIPESHHHFEDSAIFSFSMMNPIQRSNTIGPKRSMSRDGDMFQDEPDLRRTTANFSKPVIAPDARRRHGHTRSNSIGSVRDGVGNLNRWSQSTTSSRGSISRRLSLNAASGFTFDSARPEVVGNSPRKVSARLPDSGTSTVDNSPQRTLRTHMKDGSNPSAVLPPIITLPTYQHISRQHGASPQSSTDPSPSTAQLLSAAVRSTVPDYFGEWSATGSTVPGRSASVARSPLNGPPLQNSSSAAQYIRNDRERSQSRGHSRNRSQAHKGSSGTVSSDGKKSKKAPSQKAMLSQALQKANTAVKLDNAQNFEGAMQAYSEACDLLATVMQRSSGDEDRKKLEAIRNTYTSRISELEKITPYIGSDDKELPARPESQDYRSEESPILLDDDEGAEIGMAIVTRIVDYTPENENAPSYHIPHSQVPRRRESLMPAFEHSTTSKHHLVSQYNHKHIQSRARSPMDRAFLGPTSNLSAPMDRQSMMVPPLSPRREIPPPAEQRRAEEEESSPRNPNADEDRLREMSGESMSWLDTIDESGGSDASSVHSRTSSMGVRRKRIRAASGETEAEFDAALDAAVEAAYDDGFEPADDSFEAVAPVEHERCDNNGDDEYEDRLANVRMKIEMAKQRVRETELETEMLERSRQDSVSHSQSMPKEFSLTEEEEEEEQLLEEMTKGYAIDDFDFAADSRSTLPRESNSSTFSGRTWHSSLGSNPTTNGSTMSTITEAAAMPELSLLSKLSAPAHPPPEGALPPPPVSAAPTPQLSRPLPPSTSENSLNNVRNRRLSSQKAKALKIETASRSQTPLPNNEAPTVPPPKVPEEAPLTRQSSAAEMPPPSTITARPATANGLRQSSSPFPTSELPSPPTPTWKHNADLDGDDVPRSGSPGRAQSRAGLRKNFSASSLKNIKNRNLSISNVDDPDLSPATPTSGQFAMSREPSKMPTMPTLPTPLAAAFRDKIGVPPVAPSGGLYLFDTDIHSLDHPGDPGEDIDNPPVPLEPCPTEYLLRPFWLMRALYQTLTHTRGGYISTKLFVCRDVWRVKGVKLKAVEEKVGCCDFLTAALQKLAQVDSTDADAVLEEMQSLEDVLEQVRGTLTRKLGNDVGVQGSGMLFKDAAVSADADSTSAGAKVSSGTAKSSFSWRRLRSKSSGVALNNYVGGGRSVSSDGSKEGLTMASVPLTSLTSIRFAKRDVGKVVFEGVNANYMAALARLCDAAQVLDQIARQVEDPGLRHADKTQVGLELSTRHAAEFFAFYVCRFVLTDVGMLLDKFLKRGSEWVLV